MQNLGTATRTVRMSAVCALAPAGYELLAQQTDLEAGEISRSGVTCSEGKVVLGGGAGIDASGPVSHDLRLHEMNSGTLGGRAGWFPAIANHGEQTHTVTISAICADEPSNYSIQEELVEVVAGAHERRGISCPAGSVVLNGGARVVGAGSANFNMRIHESRAGELTTPLWLTAVENRSTTDRNLMFRAICVGAGALSEYAVEDVDVRMTTDSIGRETVTCPAGTQAVSGGVRLLGDLGPDAAVRIRESAPAAGEDGWTVALSSQEDAAQRAEVVAVCRSELADYTVEVEDEPLSPGGSVRATVSCPAGTVALGGGAHAVANAETFDLRVQESLPDPDDDGRWIVSMANLASGEPTVSMAAVCAQPPRDHTVVTASETVAAGDAAELEVSCPGEMRVYGGGVHVSDSELADPGIEVQQSAPTEDGAWRVVIVNTAASSRPVQVAAVCGSS
jgi:hypothetical protein